MCRRGPGSHVSLLHPNCGVAQAPLLAHIIGSVPDATLHAGCKTPAEDQPVWSCYMRSPCGAGREAILSGWSSDAPPVVLPKGVSFSVGAGTGIASVVLQVRHAAKPPGMRGLSRGV